MNQNSRSFFCLSLVICFIILASLICGAVIYKVDIVIILLMLLIFVCAVSLLTENKIENLIEYISDSLKHATGAFLIFILIGVLISVWVVSGTVPSLIYYGLCFISGKYFLLMVFLICSCISYATGTSWGTAATIGVAFMGIGKGVGIPDAVTAGTIISGVYFGDKMSPLASTTILCSSSAGTTPEKHLQSMSLSGFITFFISAFLHYILGLYFSSENGIPVANIDYINKFLSTNFNISSMALSPILTTLILSIIKVSPFISMTIGIIMGVIVAVVFQGAGITEIFDIMSNGYRVNEGPGIIKIMLDQGGVQPMMWTFSLSFIGFSLGGILDKVGYLNAILSRATARIQGCRKLSLITYISGWLGCAVTSEVYVAQMLNGRIYKDVYDRDGIDKAMLSRYIEESTTVFDMFLPWTTGGAFMATVLGVANLHYLPYSFFCLLTPVVSIVLTIFGIGIIRKRSI
ncbi:hypothetical protein NPI91_000895 [Salmonella enterica]|nr:hypothetical protein [Salmonella enterica]EKJ5694377.1 hypothetical protein [Salmonella enterica]